MVAREIDVQNNTVVTGAHRHRPEHHPQKAEPTIRTFGDDQRSSRRRSSGWSNICEAAGALFGWNMRSALSVYNDPSSWRRSGPAWRILGGAEFVRLMPADMGGEDFSEFARLTPSVILWLGVVPPGMGKTALHSPTFLADERAIEVGVNLMSGIILDYSNGAK
jgi:amidohydrolase